MTIENIDVDIEAVNDDRKPTDYFEKLWFELVEVVNNNAAELITNANGDSFKYGDGRLVNFVSIGDQFDVNTAYGTGGFTGATTVDWPTDFIDPPHVTAGLIEKNSPSAFSLSVNPTLTDIKVNFFTINSTLAVNCSAYVIGYGSWK